MFMFPLNNISGSAGMGWQSKSLFSLFTSLVSNAQNEKSKITMVLLLLKVLILYNKYIQ